MNVNLWNVLMKSDFVFDRGSYVTLRQSCYSFLQNNVPSLLLLNDGEIASFISYAGKVLGECYEAGFYFDNEAYLRQLESSFNCGAELRKRVYLHAVYDTFEQKMVMLFVAAMGLYASRCDVDDDFWEPHGLSGRFVPKEKSFEENLEQYCLLPLNDTTLSHFDRRMAVSISGLYSLAVTLMGANEFSLHLHNFFHYIRLQEKNMLLAWT